MGQLENSLHVLCFYFIFVQRVEPIRSEQMSLKGFIMFCAAYCAACFIDFIFYYCASCVG